MLIDWKILAKNIYDNLKEEVKKTDKKITLWVILVWNNSESIRYIKQKKKWADYIWIWFVLKKVEKNITEQDLLNLISDFNKSEKITWFMIQTPLPKHINTDKIIEAISASKDVDWFNSLNMGKIVIWDNSWFVACTPAGIMEIIKQSKIEIEGKHITVIWRSNIVWKPIINLLINSWATVTACNSKTPDLNKFTKISDIIIIAAWKPWLLKGSMIKHGVVVIDVWFTIIDGIIYGDAETKKIDLMWGKITPVPGWVWPMTVAMLMKNTLKAWWIIV